MLYEVAYYSDFIYINVYSSTCKFSKSWGIGWLSCIERRNQWRPRNAAAFAQA
jgi:hypothetical protein